MLSAFTAQPPNRRRQSRQTLRHRRAGFLKLSAFVMPAASMTASHRDEPQRPTPERLLWASNHGPFLLRRRQDVIDDLTGLTDRLVGAHADLLSGEPPASIAPSYFVNVAPEPVAIPRCDLAWLLTPAKAESLVFEDEACCDTVSALRPRMAETAIAVSIAAQRAAAREAASSSGAVAECDLVSRVKAEVDERWSSKELRELIDLERKHGSAAWPDAQLEADRHSELLGWRFGGPSAWLVFAAYVESELRYGPREFAASAIGGALETFHELEPHELAAASGLACLSEVSRPIWARAATVIAAWHSGPAETAHAVAPPPVARSDDSEFVSVDEASSRLGLNRKTLYDAIREPSVPGVAKIGGRIVIAWSAFRGAISRGEIDLSDPASPKSLPSKRVRR
jgi:predicted DNA-binding transcriptional regulator AlpA